MHFQSLGLGTHVLWRRNKELKGLSGALSRNKMLAGEAWEHFVPPGTARLIKLWDIPGRLTSLMRPQ